MKLIPRLVQQKLGGHDTGSKKDKGVHHAETVLGQCKAL